MLCVSSHAPDRPKSTRGRCGMTGSWPQGGSGGRGGLPAQAPVGRHCPCLIALKPQSPGIVFYLPDHVAETHPCSSCFRVHLPQLCVTPTQ